MADIFVKSSISRRTTRSFNESNLVLPRRVNGYGQNCLSYLGPTVWNNIPDETREVNTCNTFKHKIKRKYFSDIEADVNSNYNAN